MKWPLMWRKNHDTEVSKLLENALLDKQSLKRCYEERITELEAEIREKIEPVIKKFVRLKVNYDPSMFERYAIQMQLDTRWVETCLIHGNSQKEVSRMAEVISREMSYELEKILLSRNFERKYT